MSSSQRNDRTYFVKEQCWIMTRAENEDFLSSFQSATVDSSKSEKHVAIICLWINRLVFFSRSCIVSRLRRRFLTGRRRCCFFSLFLSEKFTPLSYIFHRQRPRDANQWRDVSTLVTRLTCVYFVIERFD